MSVDHISTDGPPMSQTWDKITHSKGEHEHAFPYKNVKQLFDIEPRRCDCGITLDEYIYSHDTVFHALYDGLVLDQSIIGRPHHH
jgi:hypothetical protein